MIRFLRDNPEVTILVGGTIVLIVCAFLVGLNIGLVEHHDRVMSRIERAK